MGDIYQLTSASAFPMPSLRGAETETVTVTAESPQDAVVNIPPGTGTQPDQILPQSGRRLNRAI